MLPNTEFISNSLKSHELDNFRHYLFNRNKSLSLIVWNNTNYIKSLESIYQTLQNTPNFSINIEENQNQSQNERKTSGKTFNCKLKLSKNFPVSICKSKYFKITAKIDTDSQIKLDKEDQVKVTAKLFTHDSDPTDISKTSMGKSLLKGNTCAVLAYDIVEEKHLVHFKLQIREVSSHFVGGLFSLVLDPEKSMEGKGIFIQPLVIDNIRVKAKEHLTEKFRD